MQSMKLNGPRWSRAAGHMGNVGFNLQPVLAKVSDSSDSKVSLDKIAFACQLRRVGIRGDAPFPFFILSPAMSGDEIGWRPSYRTHHHVGGVVERTS